MEFSSTEKRQPPQSHVVVVYDPRDGRILHGHEFVGDGTGLFGPEGKAERERLTLEGAQRNHGDVSRCRVLHVPTDFRFEPGVIYRVREGKLVEHAKAVPRALRAKKAKPKKKAGRRK